MDETVSYNEEIQKAGRLEYKMVERLGVLCQLPSGWFREINLVAWNGRPPKFDIRDWTPEHERMSRGITLTEEAAVKLTRILAKRLQLEEYDKAAGGDA